MSCTYSLSHARQVRLSGEVLLTHCVVWVSLANMYEQLYS